MGQMVISRTGELTQRDLAIVEWIGRVGAATIDQVARRFGLSRTRAYACVGRCVAMGLLERRRLLHRAPALLVATRDGLLGAGLALPYARSLAGAWRDTTRRAGRSPFGSRSAIRGRAILSDRELRFEERRAGRPIASAKVGELPNGAPRLHRPDFAVVGERGRGVRGRAHPEGAAAAGAAGAGVAARVARLADHLPVWVGARRGGRSSERSRETCSEERVRVASLSEVVR